MTITHTQLFDWAEYLESVDAAEDHGSDSPTGQSFQSFYGGSTNAEARCLAHEGWQEIQGEVDQLVNRITETLLLDKVLVDDFQAVYDVAGAEVDIGRYLDGTPECLVESQPIRIAKAGRAIRLIVQVNYLAEVKASQAWRRGAAVVALCEALQRCQHPLEVWTVSHSTTAKQHRKSATGVDNTAVLAVRVQKADEPVDRGRLAFALGHVGNFRRLTFAQRKHLWRDAFPNSGSEASTVNINEAVQALLPDHQGAEIVVQAMTASQGWDEDYAIRWIEQQLACIFGE